MKAMVSMRFPTCRYAKPRMPASGRQGSRCRTMAADTLKKHKGAPMPALTADLAKFVAKINPAAVPERAAFGARIGMLDCVGTMIAGANEEAVKIVARTVSTYTGNDGAPEIP